jgi:hypothetical protein
MRGRGRLFRTHFAIFVITCFAQAHTACHEAETAKSAALAEVFGEARRSYTSPDLAVGPDGEVCLVWLAFGAAGDEVLAAVRRAGSWGEPIAVSAAPGRYLSPRVAAERDGGCFVVWTALVARVEGGRVAEPAASSDLFGRYHDGTELGPVDRLTNAPGSDAAPALAADESGDLWLAWEAFRDGRFDIYARKRTAGAWGAVSRVTDHPASDSQPSVAADAAGRAFVAWMSRRNAGVGDENTEIYVRRLDLDTGLAQRHASNALPTRVSASPRLDALPMLIATSTELALVWTESYFSGSVRHDLSAILYGEARDRGYRIAWKEGDSWTSPTASRPSPLVHERVTAIPGPAERELWLLYERMSKRNERFWIPTLQRIARSVPAEPFSLGATATGLGARVAAAADRDGAWVASVVEAPPANGGRVQSAIEVRKVEASSLPPRTPRNDPPAPKRPSAAPAITHGSRPIASLGEEHFRAYFGDLHMHSNLSRDRMGYNASPDQSFRMVYDVAGLDFAGLSDHAEHFRESGWWTVTKHADLWNQPGRFVALPGYEWTSREYGHKNVFFQDTAQADPGALLDARGHTPEELWQHLGERRAVTIPHHVSSGPAGAEPTDWGFRNDHFQRLVEIFQRRGNYEFDGAPFPPPAPSFTPGHSVRAALDQGHRLGIIASPDHRGGLGLAGVWASALTREAIFEALHARRTFGTTGARLDLWMTVNGAPQGSEITTGGAVRVEATVHGTVPGLELTLVSNGEEVARQRFEGTAARFEWKDPRPPDGTRYYYLRARQTDGHLGWSSPVWVSGERVDSNRETSSTVESSRRR